MRTDVLIKEGERVDDLHRKGYVIIQDPKRFCFGVDAVILSGFARVKKGEKVLDLGTGTGILPILLEGRTLGSHFTGLEIQPESVEMARRSVALNELEEKVDIVEGDIKETAAIFGGSVFDVVTSNPPYMNEGGGLQNPSGPIRIPSPSGLDAVLNYTKHNYLYMCAKEDFSGTHNFASNYAEHMKNARRYWDALNERKIFK